MKTIRIKDKNFQPFLERELILAEVQRLAQEIEADYGDKNPVFLAILNGSFMFAAQLLSHLEFPCEISFVKLKSYIGLSSSGEVTTALGLDVSLAQRHVIILEDIIDSGRTLHAFLPSLAEMGPASVRLCSLLLKPEALAFPIKADYLGFSVPPAFLVGWGLDYDGQGRQLMDIWQVVED